MQPDQVTTALQAYIGHVGKVGQPLPEKEWQAGYDIWLAAWGACLNTPAELFIQGHAFPVRPRSKAADPLTRQEEDVMQAGLTLEDLRAMPIPVYFREMHRVNSWHGWLLLVLPYVAAHYNLASEDVFRGWVNYRGLTVVQGEVQKVADFFRG